MTQHKPRLIAAIMAYRCWHFTIARSPKGWRVGKIAHDNPDHGLLEIDTTLKSRQQLLRQVYAKIDEWEENEFEQRRQAAKQREAELILD